MQKKFYLIILEIFFLLVIYGSGLFFRLVPRLQQDSHLLTFEADIWYRITMAQNLLDHGHLPPQDIRYEAYGFVPFWYPPAGLYFFSSLAKSSGLDLPTVTSRIIPFFESLAPLSLYLFCRFLFGRWIAILAASFLALTPSFVFWSGIADPQSFILFMIPIILLLWIRHAQKLKEKKYGGFRRWIFVSTIGFLLALCFLTHLFYFLVVFILMLVTLAFFFEKMSTGRIWIDLFASLFLSQALTVWWWGPPNLYWWWFFSIVTSSGKYGLGKQLSDYGWLAGMIGFFSLFTLIWVDVFKRKKTLKSTWVLFFWALIPLVETQNETILYLLKHQELSWSTLFKPLEGFRFFCFLAQPLAVSAALVIARLTQKAKGRPLNLGKKIFLAFLPFLFFLMFIDMMENYRFFNRIKNSGFTMDEIEAAQWYSKNAKPEDRIIADYYRSYMIAGFAGGKALLGMAFPLRNVPYAHIGMKDYKVPGDIYRIFTTDNPEEAVLLMKRYNATHLFISANMGRNGNFITSHQQGFGIKFNFKTLQNPKYFKTVYQKEKKVVILERLS